MCTGTVVSQGPKNAVGAHGLRRMREDQRPHSGGQKLSRIYIGFRKKSVHDKVEEPKIENITGNDRGKIKCHL